MGLSNSHLLFNAYKWMEFEISIYNDCGVQIFYRVRKSMRNYSEELFDIYIVVFIKEVCYFRIPTKFVTGKEKCALCMHWVLKYFGINDFIV